MTSSLLQKIIFICLIPLVLEGCSVLKPLPPQPKILSLPQAEYGLLNKVTSQVKAIHGSDRSTFLLLTRNDDALNWRLALIDHAVTSIDVQYFIWSDDEVGNLLLDRLLRAADRGVRIRLLVDDFPLASKTRDLSLLSRHPFFEIKIFNPNYVRDNSLGGTGEFLLYFNTLNRRMHNKLFIVDGQMAIIGGRNIGNPYFGLSKPYNFVDIDTLVAGEVIQELSQAFDQYWNIELAYPSSAMAELNEDENEGEIRESITTYLEKNRSLLGQYPFDTSDWEDKMRHLPTSMKTGIAHVIQDTPTTVDKNEPRLIDMLDYLAQPSQEELTIVTPYLIPVDDFLEALTSLSSQGVIINIITNSLGSNNHTMVHSHYKKYRRQILATGANLYELRHDPSQKLRNISDAPPIEANFTSLHIKAMVVDRKSCYIGSLNLDPRALKINTENGLYIESEPLALELSTHLEEIMSPENSWQVYLNEKEELRWKSGSEVLTLQPVRNFGQRISDFFYRLLPIESQL